ncbi:hypothetical protein CHGG_07459 [Chaetomium globosum CBS 148.51]|uniref:Prion-inhibition and propagation HeLo domain-containing protein n=1 Tax=Chaetomium globosum (strain ATCC 6205 / CBS 148.51 / DSM 1962 / NBRC 6347 / NRRL 1970) TaxID=306901 RepID=Q2GX45_CHAGB|nr:uncharacterized protein CHGG_07459 [Chaetomium globosum CBS 148.51]EAQ86206.1 hypothetical protein CHGG_07459 [Chaetomium globosum CBS 148.51]
MEVAGLALGVVGVAGILSTLKDVAELYSLFVDSRSVGRDYEMLDTKLDIERTMLLHWADRVGLLRDDYDPRLDIPNTQETVFRLNDLLPATSGPSVSQSEPSPTQELTSQSAIGTRGIPNTAQEAVDQKYQDKILETLWFRTMEAREEEIKPAHAKTLNWALEPPDGKVQWDDLSEWLRSGEDIYWVSGKAGSGKSTLMKRLYHHPRTKELLTEWANGGPVTLASFFFWNLGTPEQKTQEGLSRSLLHQILSRHPSLIREALPGMWKELHITKATPSLPTLTETHHAFRTISTKTHSLHHKFCFLIDGLDEFTGDHRHAITFLQELTTNPGFKALVSSRPIPACVAAFDDLPTLPLHHLTHHDIATYVDATLTAHKTIQKLLNTRRHAAKARRLTHAIINKSTGVFLWVVLACRAVLEGLADGDGIDDVLRRVDELPPELEDMFRLMLARVGERYREQGAFTLRVCHAISAADSPASSHFGGRLNALPVALLCREGGEPGVLEEEEREEIREELGGWLASRCGGLLVMGGEGGGGDGYQVAWVHRSVVEFLNGDGVWDLEYLRVGEDRPRVQAALSVYALHSVMQDNHRAQIIYNIWYCGALVLGARADAEEPEGRDHSFWHIDPFLRWLRQVEPMPPGTESLGPLKRLLVRHTDASQGVAHAALVLAAESGAINYMKAHPNFPEFCQPGVHISCGCFPLFYHATAHPLSFSIMSAHPPGPPSALRTTISFFLSLGADPNMTVTHRLSEPAGQATYLDTLDTPWRGWIGWALNIWSGRTDRAAVADIMAMFLAAGAHPTEEVPAWILPYLADPKYRDTLTVSDAQLAGAVSALRGEMLQAGQEGKHESKEEDGRLWLHSTTRSTVYWDGEPYVEM